MPRTKTRRSIRAGLLGLMLCGTPAVAGAQEGAIAGTVRAPGGAEQAGVSVEVSGPALIEGVRTAVTDERGRYRVAALRAGVYTVAFSGPSFATLRQEEVVVAAGTTAALDAGMVAGDASEELVVPAAARAIDVRETRQVTVFRGDELRALPGVRNLSTVAPLLPGMRYQTGLVNQTGGLCLGGAGTWCTPNLLGFNTHGAGDADHLGQGQLRVDGLLLNSASHTVMGNLSGYVVDVATAEQVTVVHAGALGESETGGAVVDVVPRVGGNAWRGAYATSYATHQWWSRNNETRRGGQALSILSDHDVSGSIGGPLVRDRLWLHSVLRTQGKHANPGGPAWFYNRNAGHWGANYQPDRDRGRVTYRNLWRNVNARLALRAAPRHTLRVSWDEQEACQDPCDGAVSSTWSPEANWSVRVWPNRVQQVSWTSPVSGRLLVEGALHRVAQHYDFTRHKHEPNPQQMPQIRELGSTVGADEVAARVHGLAGAGGSHGCLLSAAVCSGSIDVSSLDRIGQVRSRLSASYIARGHQARIGWEGQFFRQAQSRTTNAPQMAFHYTTPAEGCYNAADPALSLCGNTSRYSPDDPFNEARRPVPVGVVADSGPRTLHDRLTTQALYVQDEWTAGRLTLRGALRYDHARSDYEPTCVGPNRFVPQPFCTEAGPGVRYHDLSPRASVAVDLTGDGRTAFRWHVGRYLGAARFSGAYTAANLARRTTDSITRDWSDANGDRMPDCDWTLPNAHDHLGDACGAVNALRFSSFGRSPIAIGPDGFAPGLATVSCGQAEVPLVAGAEAYCGRSGQDVLRGWTRRRYEWQVDVGLQRELRPRLSAEISYHQRWHGNLTVSDVLGAGCDGYDEGTAACQAGMAGFDHPQYSFFRVQAPVDDRLPGGGGYWVTGLSTRATLEALPTTPAVLTLQSFERGWMGLETRVTLRGRGGLRLDAGTSTGRASTDACAVAFDAPLVRMREGGRGPECAPHEPFRTQVRGSATYTIPWIDVLASAVFQSRPGPSIAANMAFDIAGLAWEPASDWRATNTLGCTSPAMPVGCFFGSSATTVGVNLLDAGDQYGSRFNLVDLKLSKDIRLARRRVNLGVDLYNLFNSDAIVSYNSTYNPAIVQDEAGNDVVANSWRSSTALVAPRFARVVLQVDF